MSESSPRFVTCRCQNCDGGIEFDANELDEGETRTVECAHCQLETIMFVPHQSLPPPIPKPPPPTVMPPPAIDETANARSSSHYNAVLSVLQLDPRITPFSVEKFIGQERVKRAIGSAFEEAEKGKERPPHILLIGPGGSGKTSLALLVARAFANTAKTSYRASSAQDFRDISDFAKFLGDVGDSDICLIDDIDLLDPVIKSRIPSAIVNFKFDIGFWSGPGARLTGSNLPRFTPIATATDKERLSPFMLACFPVVEELDAYSTEEISEITCEIAHNVGLDLDKEAAEVVAVCADGTPKLLPNLLELVRVYTHARSSSKRITFELAADTFQTIFPAGVGGEQSNGRPAIPAAVRREVWRRDEGKCARCGSRENLEYDHIIPVSKGGGNTARNIELLCQDCNRSKGDSIQ